MGVTGEPLGRSGCDEEAVQHSHMSGEVKPGALNHSGWQEYNWGVDRIAKDTWVVFCKTREGLGETHLPSFMFS